MLKKIQFALLLCCINISAYAYVVGVNFTVQNKTDTPMTIVIKQPNGQDPVTQLLAPHKTSIIYLENNDHSILLYQSAIAPFTISANNNIYAQGRIIYYVGSSLWDKYSFLDNISVADGITIDPDYSCENNGNHTIENKIIISGKTSKTLTPTKFSNSVICQGLKSSSFRDRNNFYTPACFDNETTIFWKTNAEKIGESGTLWEHHYTNGHDYFTLYSTIETDETPLFQTALKKQIGEPFCKTKFITYI